MKFTRQTIDILKNFSDINSSILVKTGSELETISPLKNVLAKSNVTENFQQQFGIYDLVEFLGLITSESLEDAELEFESEWVNMVNGSDSSKYYYADPATIVHPEKTLVMPEAEINFEFTQESLNKTRNASGILSKPDLAITSDGESISVVVLDKKDPTSNHWKRNVGSGNGDEYTAYFKTENIKVLRGSYDVSISSRGISHWSNVDIPLEYWIALEPDSIYGTLGDKSI